MLDPTPKDIDFFSLFPAKNLVYTLSLLYFGGVGTFVKGGTL